MIHLSLRKNIQEIKNSKALTLFGLCLALTNFVTLYSWWFDRSFFNIISPSNLTYLCWPFFQNCSEFYLNLGPDLLKFLYLIFFLSNCLSLIAFALKKIEVGYYACLNVFILKLFFFISSYSFNGNYHYMAIFMHLLFLFSMDKKRTLPLMLIGLYFSAGLLKFNHEWLSGAAMIATPMVKGKLIEIALAFVILFEILIIWGVLSKNFYIFWGTFFIVVSFHGFSWHLVGYFYPMTMIFLVLIFPLTRLYSSIDNGYFKSKPIMWLGLLLTLQLSPYLYNGDHAIHGQGRLFKLHMFDIFSHCEYRAIYHHQNQSYELPIHATNSVRGRCDIYKYITHLKYYCHNQVTPEGEIEFTFYGKRSTDKDYHKVAFINDVCSPEVSYNFFMANPWILKKEEVK